MGKTALVAGATGLVGSELVNILLESSEYDNVIILVRRCTEKSHEKLIEKVVNFDQLDTLQIELKVDHVFCCIGTTIKKAKTKEAFKKVDLEYPIALGKWAKLNKATQFLIITSIGANANSRIFYSQTKGLLEQELRKIGLPGLHIFRPSLLLGKRNEYRFGEEIAAKTSKIIPFVFKGYLKKYQPIHAYKVAYGMYRVAINEINGINTYSSNEIGRYYEEN